MAEDLQSAARAVSEFMQGKDVKENTVLAAHIRREGAQARGDVWSLAKHYLSQGYSFNDAARAAVHGLQAPADAPTEPALAGTGEANEPSVREVELGFEGDTTELPPTRLARPDVEPLDWYPKRYSPGDIDGDGAKKLLGTPSIPLASVLVRETAQNSWDARSGTSDVDFVMNMRLLTQAETDILREICFPETATDVHIVESMEKPIWVLEISDRGTVGLRGPTRNDLAVPDDMPTNFIDLVFNLGGKHEIAASGGTYGFGKTVAYKASRLGTVLMWSRISSATGFEDRIIGSCIGDRFDMDGFRYTGRHWWGRMVDNYIQPVTGRNATAIGEAVFSKGFGHHEAGTSILILCPDLDSESREQEVGLLAEAVRWHLWPKRLEAQDSDVSMNIDVQLNGRSIQIFPDSLENPMLESLDACLLAVRAQQAGDELPESFPPVVVEEVWCQRPLALLGHLALQRFQDRPIDTFAAEIMPIDQPARHVALMRNSAELVVKYLPSLPLDTPGFSWTGVFKPIGEMDSLFASSEPPAHDDWVPDGANDKWGRTQIRVGLRRIKTLADNFAQPLASFEEQYQRQGSVAGIADALADLIPLVTASRPEPRPTHSAPGSRKPKVAVIGKILGPTDSNDDRLVALQLLVTGASLPIGLVARSAVGVDGGSDRGEGDVEVVGWSIGKPTLKLSAAHQGEHSSFTSAEESCWVLIRAKADLALDVQIDVVD